MISIPNLGLSSSFASANLSAERYFRRALEKQRKGDYEGAIADYNEAIRIQPDVADAYLCRGITKSALGDKPGALEDFREAVRLYQIQGNTEWLAKAQKQIKELGR